jgi:hypothetical protein
MTRTADVAEIQKDSEKCGGGTACTCSGPMGGWGAWSTVLLRKSLVYIMQIVT